MLLISTGIFDDKLHPQILSVGTTANAADTTETEYFVWRRQIYIRQDFKKPCNLCTLIYILNLMVPGSFNKKGYGCK
jgi:hypothetical protein